MILEINGFPYDGFTSASVKRSVDAIASELLFEATSDKISNYPIKNFSKCKVFTENYQILDGYIDIINVSYDSSSHGLSIQGRSKTSILVDSSVFDRRTFKGKISLKKIIENVISDLGVDISVINEVSGEITDFENDVNAEVGESAFAFIERLCRKKQVMCTTDIDGDLVLTRGQSSRISTILLMQKDNFDNNILSASVSFDTSQRFRNYKVLGQSFPGLNISNENTTSQSGQATDTEANEFKKLIIPIEQETDGATSKDRAVWEANIRRAKSIKYSCKVQGHVHADGLWEPNTIVKVVDEYSNIDSEMLINSVEYTFGNDGTFTNLELISPDAYTLESERSLFDKKIDSLGLGFE